MRPTHLAARAYASWDTHDLYVFDEMHNREALYTLVAVADEGSSTRNWKMVSISKNEFSATTLYSLYFSKLWSYFLTSLLIKYKLLSLQITEI